MARTFTQGFDQLRQNLQVTNTQGELVSTRQHSAPSSRVVETWKLERVVNETKAIRAFELNTHFILSKSVFRLIPFFLKRSVARHLTELKPAEKES